MTNVATPQVLFIEITSECNLRCKHCHMWMNKDDMSKALSIDEKIALIEQFKEMNPHGGIVLTGGEIMCREEEFFILAKRCKDIGIGCAGLSNASLIDDKNYDRMLIEGPSYLQISLDSHIPEIHDYIRGTKGSFLHTVSVLKNLMTLKEKKGSDTKIVINCVLFDGNILSCDEFIDFIKTERLADGITLNCLVPTLQNRNTKGDSFFDKKFFQDKQSALKAIDNLIRKYENDTFVLTKREEFELMKMYIDNRVLLHQNYQVCNSAEKNLIVDLYGNYSLCFYMDTLAINTSIGNFRDMSIHEFWHSEQVKQLQTDLNLCRKDCGLLPCHRNNTITIS